MVFFPLISGAWGLLVVLLTRAGHARQAVNSYMGHKMGLFRILSWVLVGLGIALVGADGVSTLEQGEPVVRTTTEVLGLLGLTINPMEGGGFASVVNFILEVPLWAFVGGIGFIMALIFRPLD